MKIWQLLLSTVLDRPILALSDTPQQKLYIWKSNDVGEIIFYQKFPKEILGIVCKNQRKRAARKKSYQEKTSRGGGIHPPPYTVGLSWKKYRESHSKNYGLKRAIFGLNGHLGYF